MRRKIMWLVSLVILVTGCTGGGQPCETNRDCPDDHICRYDQCLETDWTDELATGAPDVEPDGAQPDTSPSIGPRLEAPETVEFNTPGSQQTIQVTNTGDGALTIESTDLDHEAFSLTSEQSSAELSPGETLAIGIRYDSAGPGTHEATLTLETTPDAARTTIELVGQTDQCLEVTPPNAIRFDLDSPEDSREKTIQATNCDDGRIVSVSAEIRGEDADAFEFPFAESEAELRPGGDVSAPVLFGPTDEPGRFEAELVIQTNLPNRESIVVDLLGVVEGSSCPTPDIEPRVAATGRPVEGGTVAPGQNVILDASGSEPADRIESYQWTALSAPSNARPTFRPNNNAPDPEVSLDFAGAWRFELALEGPDRWESCQPATVEVRAVPQDDIYVELKWTTPGDDNPADNRGADIDLHYLNPKASQWNEAPWDIYWDNKTADWGSGGASSDDPELTLDADHAPGPEAVAHDSPSPGRSYTVGAYYYAPNDFGPSYVTARIFIRGQLAKSYEDRQLAEVSDFWKIAQIDWPSGNIYERDEIRDGFPQPL
jgi:hypothetical protein